MRSRLSAGLSKKHRGRTWRGRCVELRFRSLDNNSSERGTDSGQILKYFHIEELFLFPFNHFWNHFWIRLMD